MGANPAPDCPADVPSAATAGAAGTKQLQPPQGAGQVAAQGRRGVFRNLMPSTMFLYAARSSSYTAILLFSLVAAPKHTFHGFADS